MPFEHTEYQYIIRERDSHAVVYKTTSYKNAVHLVELYEDEDRQHGIYTEDFYEIVEIQEANTHER